MFQVFSNIIIHIFLWKLKNLSDTKNPLDSFPICNNWNVLAQPEQFLFSANKPQPV